MRRLDIAESVLRDLVARYPFYEIARLYRCDTRTIGALATRYGLTSAFAARAGTEEEAARIRALSAEGWPIIRIAETMGRSQEFVARRVYGVMNDPDGPKPSGRIPRAGWPVPCTTAKRALGAQRYDDVDENTLVRECPPHLPPINGAALTSAAQAGNRSYSRSSADLCAEE